MTYGTLQVSYFLQSASLLSSAYYLLPRQLNRLALFC